MITLRQLRYFSALAETLHFGRAAKACAVTQPALSMQIKGLESELGLPLTERRKAGIRLTGEGREVAERATQILRDVQDLRDSISNRQGELGRTLSFGVIPTIAPYFLPVVLPDFQRRFPELELRLHEAQTVRLLEKLDRGELDVALLALPAGDGSCQAMPLFEDRFLLAAPAAEKIPEIVNVDDLQADSLILLEEGHCLREQALAVCNAVDAGTMNRFGATSLATILQLVANGYGTTLVPEMAVSAEIQPGAPLLLRKLEPEPTRTVGLIWRNSAARQERYRRLGDVLREIWQTAERKTASAREPAN